MKSKVYFTSDISEKGLKKVYDALGVKLEGRVAIKVHSGEKGNQNFLKPEFFKNFINNFNGNVVECNTAYEGERNTTEKHLKLIKDHGWSKYFNVDIMDSEGDVELKIDGGEIITSNFVGKNLFNYNSLLVLSHFKGHPMGGFGGALKQLSIGCASTQGKCWIHSAGVTKNPKVLWNNLAKQDDFIDAMGESASTIVKLFKNKLAFINIMCNMSVDCDCCAVAENPCLKDIGILASIDPVAIDKACIDLVYSSNDVGKAHFIERVESRHGCRILDTAEKFGAGTKNYELINLD